MLIPPSPLRVTSSIGKPCLTEIPGVCGIMSWPGVIKLQSRGLWGGVVYCVGGMYGVGEMYGVGGMYGDGEGMRHSAILWPSCPHL